MKLKRPLCLASASPRRAELLTRFGLSFRVQAADLDETPQTGEAPEALVRRLAAGKAGQVAETLTDHLVLAGDTVVAYEGTLLNKPADAGDNLDMLRRLSGHTHQVVTGYQLLDAASGQQVDRTVTTQVTFRQLSEDWMQWYTAQGEGLDKAGGYGIQGLGGALVERIEGSYTNVVGLPVEAVLWDLHAHGWLELEA